MLKEIVDYYNSCESTEDAVLDDFFSGEIMRRLGSAEGYSDRKNKLLEFKAAFEDGTSLQSSLVAMIMSILGGDELSDDNIPPKVKNEFIQLNKFLSFYPSSLIVSKKEEEERIEELYQRVELFRDRANSLESILDKYKSLESELDKTIKQVSILYEENVGLRKENEDLQNRINIAGNQNVRTPQKLLGDIINSLPAKYGESIRLDSLADTTRIGHTVEIDGEEGTIYAVSGDSYMLYKKLSQSMPDDYYISNSRRLYNFFDKYIDCCSKSWHLPNDDEARSLTSSLLRNTTIFTVKVPEKKIDSGFSAAKAYARYYENGYECQADKNAIIVMVCRCSKDYVE